MIENNTNGYHYLLTHFRAGSVHGMPCSVTRLGDFLDFGQLFKALSNNEFAQISNIPGHFL